MAKKTIPTANKDTKKQIPIAEQETVAEMTKGKEAMAFHKINYIMVIIGVVVIVIGFLLMVGDSSNTEAYNPDIFSARRTKVAPMVCLAGFLFMIVAILYHKKEEKNLPSTSTQDTEI